MARLLAQTDGVKV